MATTTTITKMLFRRGNDSDRQQTILASGEPGWALDTKRLWIGDGVTPGGYPALSGADQHLHYTDASGQQGAGPQKLDINIHGLSASLVGDGEYDRSVHGTDRTINTDYPLQFSTISQTEPAIFYNGDANTEFLINRTSGGTINIGNAVYIDLDSSGNGSVRFTADSTTFEAAKLVFAESDTTVYEDNTIDLNVNVVNGAITQPGTGGTSEKTGLYFGHKNYLSAGHVAVGHVGDDTGWSTIQIQPPVYENDWLSGETILIDRLDRPENTTSSWVSDGMSVGSGLNACKPLVLKSARPSVYSGNADLVFETGLIVYGEGANDIGGWNGYLINQSLDSGAHPTFTGITIENTDGTPGEPMNVRSGGTGNNGFAPGGVILSHTTTTTGALSSLVLNSGELITGSNTGAKATKISSNSWLNVTSDNTTGVITIDNRLVPAASYVDDNTTVVDYFNKWYNVATNTGNVNPSTNKTSIEFIGDGATTGSTSQSDVNISTSTLAGNKVGINHKLHAATLFDANVVGNKKLATFTAAARDAINSITFNKAGHITDIGTYDPGENYLELDHVGTEDVRPTGSLLAPSDVIASASSSSPAEGKTPVITQTDGGHATVVTGIDFNDYGTVAGVNTFALKDSYFNKKEIGEYVHGLNAGIIDLNTRLGTAAFLKTDASSFTTGASLTTSWKKKGKVGFAKDAGNDITTMSQQDDGFDMTTLGAININMPQVTDPISWGSALKIKHGADEAAVFTNKECSLKWDNAWRIKTTADGVSINTQCHATSFHGSGAALDLSQNTSIADGDFVKKSVGGTFVGNVGFDAGINMKRKTDDKSITVLRCIKGGSVDYIQLFDGDTSSEGGLLLGSNKQHYWDADTITFRKHSPGSSPAMMEINKTTGVTVGGNINATGFVSASGDVIAFASSDERLKDNLKPISDPLEKISNISGYEFDWNDKQNLYSGHDVGVVAQEIEQVIPEIVTERDDGYKAVKYEKLVPLLIESIKELTAKVEELESKLK